jgi:hypothetical protein
VEVDRAPAPSALDPSARVDELIRLSLAKDQRARNALDAVEVEQDVCAAGCGVVGW